MRGARALIVQLDATHRTLPLSLLAPRARFLSPQSGLFRQRGDTQRPAMFASVVLIASLLCLGACLDSPPADECKNIDTWSFALREFLFLPEESISLRVSEWFLFCDSNASYSSLPPATLQSLWLEQTVFLPLAVCDCQKPATASQPLDTAESISAAVFVDYPILGLILLILAYILRIYHAQRQRYDVEQPSFQALHDRHVHQTSHDFNCGPELLR